MTSFQPCGEFLNARVYLTRGRSREQAAAHIGVGTTTFDQMVADGRMPQPRIIGGRVVWCVYELDEYFDRLPRPSLSPESSSRACSTDFSRRVTQYTALVHELVESRTTVGVLDPIGPAREDLTTD